MDSIGDIMMSKFKVEKPKNGINSPFNEAVERVRTTITDQPWTFKRWCGYLRGIPPSTIHDMLGRAKDAKSIGKKFNWLVKEYKNERKKCL